MINIFNGMPSSIAKMTQANSNSEYALTDELQSIAPEITEELLSKFSQEKVEQLLHQELSKLIPQSTQQASSTYKLSNEELTTKTIFTNYQEGLTQNKNSDDLLAYLDKSVQDVNTAYTNTSDILLGLGQLGHEQKSFLAKSKKSIEETVQAYKDDVTSGFELSVKTQEGDIVRISIDYSKNDSIEENETILNYEVEGDLSEAEHKALTEVLSGVGKMADDYFSLTKTSKYGDDSLDKIDMTFLADFNSQQLSGFDVSFSKTHDNKDDNKNTKYENDALSLSYNISKEQQGLVFESSNGAEKINFALDMSIFGNKDDQQMQQYLSTLDKNLEDNRQNSKGNSKDNESIFGRQSDMNMRKGFALFKDAFSSMSTAAEQYSSIESIAKEQFTNGQDIVADLVDKIIIKDPRNKDINQEQTNALGTGISKLADFDAKFEFSKANKTSSTSAVELKQSTELNKSGNSNEVNQSKTANTHLDYQLDRPDHYNKKEEYEINAAAQNGELVEVGQSNKVDIDKKTYQKNPLLSQYELKTKFAEKTTSESNIRIIDNVLLKTLENSSETNKTERVKNEGKFEDYKQTNHHSYNKLVSLIGDLDKLVKKSDT
ncbi:hypothetical protein [Pseudoalteromonas sp. S558]|uniref:hypothetical protein n=1 Tax=Pseudoalteromonas sp. S558 TaxID=2066515 RepID=UPI00110A664F|nr:hypothetical protein [Pseudoalteromonas sp. S558]TMO09469.1 hypothetical protein CWB66_01900 [Pseudoalteromonas sp. S558]